MPDESVEGSVPETGASNDGLSIEAARELLISQGVNVLNSDEMHGLKAKAAEKAERRAQELEAKLNSISAEHQKLAEWKQAQDNAGKDASELWAERQRAWENSDREAKEAMKALEKERDSMQAQLAKERVENRLRSMLTSVTPGGEEAAMLWAQTKIGARLSTNDAGDLVWTTETGIPHEGIAAQNMISEWWNSDAQKFLRSGNPVGPATSGSKTTAPPQKPVYEQLDPRKYSAQERIEHAKKWQREHGNQGILTP